MPIKVVCKCGRSLNAPDSAIGKHGTCPSCGDRFLIAAQEDVILTEAPIEYPVGYTVDLGTVKSRMAQFKFSFQIEKNRNAFVEIIATQAIGRSHQLVMAG
jgi:hypothetical protein